MAKHLYLFMRDRKAWIMIPLFALLLWFGFVPASAIWFRAFFLAPWTPGVMQAAFTAGVFGLTTLYAVLWVIEGIYERFLTWLYPYYLEHYVSGSRAAVQENRIARRKNR